MTKTAPKSKARRITPETIQAGLLKTTPNPPRGLRAPGSDAWEHAVAYLVAAKLLTGADLALLERYCRLVDYAAELEVDIEANGAVLPDGKINPALRAHTTVTNAIKGAALSLHVAPYSRVPLVKSKREADAGDEEPSPLAKRLEARK